MILDITPKFGYNVESSDIAENFVVSNMRTRIRIKRPKFRFNVIIQELISKARK